MAFALLALLPRASKATEELPEVPNNPATRTVIVPAIGMQGFRYILHRRGLEPLESVDEVDSQTVIVLLGPGSIDWLRAHRDKIIRAIRKGASILVATDTATRDALVDFGVEITGERVGASSRDCFLGRQDFPFVVPFSKKNSANDSSPTSVFRGFTPIGPNAVATNTTSIVHRRRDLWNPWLQLEDLACYPRSSVHLYREEKSPLFKEDLFAAGGTLNSGRFLILGDHSVFLNWMILSDGNSNREFIHSCMDWLQGTSPPKTKCLFVDDGEIKTDFDLPVIEPQLPWLEMLLKALMVMEKHGDQMAAQTEERDLYNQMILKHFSVREIIRFVLIVATLGLLFLGFTRLFRSRLVPDRARTLVTPELAAMIPHGSVLQQRFNAQLASENVSETAREMIRDFLAGLDAEPDPLGQPPALIIDEAHRDTAELRRKITRLWGIAFGHEPVPIQPEDWRGVMSDLKDVLADADVGWWRFVPETRSSADGRNKV